MDWLAATGNKDAWRSEAQEILQKEEMRECTFHPTVHASEPVAHKHGASMPKCEQLYAKAKPAYKKKDRSNQDYEFEMQKEECTF